MDKDGMHFITIIFPTMQKIRFIWLIVILNYKYNNESSQANAPGIE